MTRLALRRGTSKYKYSITQHFKPPTHTNQTDPNKETKEDSILNANIIHIYPEARTYQVV
jgi:hypothetical protein